MRKNSKSDGNQFDEVEQLLQAAQDQMLLDLRIDSHTSRSPATVADGHLHPDLDRRFQALRSRPSIPTNLDPPLRVPSDGLGDDLFARFAALKGSSSSSPAQIHVAAKPDSKEADGDEEDEVQKVIQWAMDAARLDPSPPSDEEEEEDDTDEEKEQRKK